ncbi:MAG: Uma2 family endonuclease [Cyanobacteria bacterium P01_F01_bin.150]
MTFLDLKATLPTSAELPCSDDTPVDNEDQNFLPNFLLFLLRDIWLNRMDWYFGVDMGIYHTTGANVRVPVVPDGFLSVGVERRKGGKSRKSYVMWEEEYVAPIFVLEMVSWTPGNEYTDKLEIYRKLGVLYYLIYNPEFWQRDGHKQFEVYKLVNGKYQLQCGEPFWMPEVGLGIGRHQRSFGPVIQEMLYWYDAQGKRYLAADEQVASAQERVTLAEQQAKSAEEKAASAIERASLLEQKLKELGIDPSELG